MSKTILYVNGRQNNKRLAMLQAVNKYLHLGYDIKVITPDEYGGSRGKRANYLYQDDLLDCFDYCELVREQKNE